MWRSLPRHKTPAFAPVLFQQGHAVHGHAQNMSINMGEIFFVNEYFKAAELRICSDC
jgi:hypothetical protein